MHPVFILLLTALAIAAPSPNPNTKAPLSIPLPAPALPSDSQSLSSFLRANIADKRSVLQPKHVVKDAAMKNKRQTYNSTIPANDTASGPPQASVELCTEPQFQGECYNATWPVNTCIDLRGYAGATLSFAPASGFSCLLTQNRCDASDFYIEVSGDDVEELKQGSDLSGLEWINEARSYICFTDVEILRRFVVRSRLRVANAAAASAGQSFGRV